MENEKKSKFVEVLVNSSPMECTEFKITKKTKFTEFIKITKIRKFVEVLGSFPSVKFHPPPAVREDVPLPPVDQDSIDSAPTAWGRSIFLDSKFFPVKNNPNAEDHQDPLPQKIILGMNKLGLHFMCSIKMKSITVPWLHLTGFEVEGKLGVDLDDIVIKTNLNGVERTFYLQANKGDEIVRLSTRLFEEEMARLEVVKLSKSVEVKKE